MFPKLAWTRRQYRLRDVDEITNESFRLWSKRQREASIGAEKVSYDRIRAPLHALEQQCRATFVDHAAVNLGELEVRIDLSLYRDDFVFSCEQIEKAAQVRMHFCA